MLLEGALLVGEEGDGREDRMSSYTQRVSLYSKRSGFRRLLLLKLSSIVGVIQIIHKYSMLKKGILIVRRLR
jgi:hypothetical protein